jgi:subtilisin-like proprotein convertase family protein
MFVPKRWPPLAGFLFALAAFCVRADTFTFSNTNYISINDSTNPPTIATPYPSAITVTGLTGQVITNVTVTLSNFSHTFPSDVSIILVGPQGQMSVLMSDVGGVFSSDAVTNVVLVLDDQAQNALPQFDMLTAGTYRPAAYPTPLTFNFPPPVPAGNSNAPPTLSVFDNTDPDGVWSLYVVDDVAENAGSISRGWSISVYTGIPLKLKPSGTNLILSWPNVSGHTFTVQFTPNLTNAALWSNLPTTPALVSGLLTVTNTNIGKAGYFRLLVH